MDMASAKPGARRQEYERQAREKAFAGARLALEKNLSHGDAARITGSNRHAISDAFTLLKFCTPEEIAKVENGEIPMRKMSHMIKERVSPEDRFKARRAPVRTGGRPQRELDSLLWNQLRGAFEAIGSMPMPTDIMSMIKQHAKRRAYIDRELLRISDWIREFADAWTK